METAVRLVVITGPPAAGKTTFSPRLATQLGASARVFKLDDYIGRGGPWSNVRASFLPDIGGRIGSWLTEGAMAIFDGVLVEANEVPTLTSAAGLTRRQTFVVVIERSLAACWERWRRKPGAIETEGGRIRTLSDFQSGFYDPYYPQDVEADLTLSGSEVDGDVGIARVLRKLAARR